MSGTLDDAPELIRELASFLYAEGTPVQGSDLTEEQAIEIVTQDFPSKPYCLVANWRLITLDIDPEQARGIRDSGAEPVIVYSPEVLNDSSNRFRRGMWVRSTLQLSFTRGFLFETPNTVYVLMGKGSAKLEKPEVVMSIF